MNEILKAFPLGKAAIFSKPGVPFELTNNKVPRMLPGEVLVKILYTTICGSDIHTFCGRRAEPARVVLGHEIVGEILWIDPNHPGTDLRFDPISVGDRITWSIFSVPRGIEAPRADMPQKSDQLFKYGHALAKDEDVFNGGLADYCILKANTAIIKISKKIPMKVAATINCAHSTVMGALRVAGEIHKKRVLVFGAGLLGLSCVAMCKEAGAASIGLIDPDTRRLKWGEKFGADALHDFPGTDYTGLEFPWHEADIVFDMTGNPKGMELGVTSLALGGVAVWIGAVFPEKPVEINGQLVVRKLLSIRGLHNYNYEDFLGATSFIENFHKKYPFEELIEQEYSLEKVDEAFAYAVKSKPVRVGIKISED